MSAQVLGQSADWFAETLQKIDACPEARTATAGQTLEQAWATCQNGGWMCYWLSDCFVASSKHYRKVVRPAIFARFGTISGEFIFGGGQAVQTQQPALADYLRTVITPEGLPVQSLKPSPLHVRLYDLLTDGQRSYYTQFYLAQATGAPEASVRRAIQTLRKAHNISFSDGYGGGYRLLQGA